MENDYVRWHNLQSLKIVKESDLKYLSNNIVTQWQAMSTLDIAKASLKKISPNNLNPTPFKGLTTVALLGAMYFSYDIQKSWGERYDYLKNIN